MMALIYFLHFLVLKNEESFIHFLSVTGNLFEKCSSNTKVQSGDSDSESDDEEGGAMDIVSAHSNVWQFYAFTFPHLNPISADDF